MEWTRSVARRGSTHWDALYGRDFLAGWGATWQAVDSAKLWLARGFFNHVAAHINVRELEAVGRAVRAFFQDRDPCMWRRIRLCVDNQVALHLLTNFSTRSLHLMPQLRAIFYALDSRRLLLQPEYIRSVDNFIPDRLSRMSNNEDYRLSRQAFDKIQRCFGRRTVDRFATFANRQLERFNSLTADIASEGIDAFAQDWSGERNWANPPWSLLPRLVAFLRARPRVEAVVLAPEWPQALWFRPLAALA